MSFETTLSVFELAGVFVFAVSGALAAARKGMDVVGLFALALVTSTGGGALRSVLIGDFPVPFLRTPWPLAFAAVAAVLTQLFSRWLEARMDKPIRFFDAIGLGVFMSTGAMVALQLGQPWWAALFLGCVTAVFGSVLRDLLRQEVPLLFQPAELYATAALIGGVALVAAHVGGLPRTTTMLWGAGVTIAVRLFALYFHWRTKPPVA
ncbi:MAG: trimeric intracellular cation channel family protein [Opitutaceae bacterium]|nr:trimeric intracellular cation channel family protein [Opitutaceae bacterium]